MPKAKERFIRLPFDCYCTQLKVFPKNWKEAGASLHKDWYIWYRFYDPTVKDENGKMKPKLVPLRGMNIFKTLAARREATEALIKDELNLLQVDGYNPITAQYMIEHEDEFAGEIDPDTPFIESLKKARELLTCGDRTKRGIKSVINGIEQAAIQLRFHILPVCKVGRKHIKRILSRCQEINSKFSATTYNNYRGYLMMLYKELVEQEAVAGNPIRDISKRTTIERRKVVLSDEERRSVNDHLAIVFPRFLAFVHLFFHSGGRKTELFQLKPDMVDLKRQVYRCLVKKRKKWAEVERPIKDIALPFWEFFLEGCPIDKFIFGTRFLPGDKPMGIDMPSRYWKEYIKDPADSGGLGINVDFYALKHLNTTETVDMVLEQILDAQTIAARQNAHTSVNMVAKVYDIKSEIRKKELLKKVNNKFA